MAMRSGAHEGLMCPLEKGVRGIEIGHQTTGRVRVFATANTWRTQSVDCMTTQGIIRCRAGAGGQWQPCGDGKPVGPDRPLEKGVGGIRTNARS